MDGIRTFLHLINFDYHLDVFVCLPKFGVVIYFKASSEAITFLK